MKVDNIFHTKQYSTLGQAVMRLRWRGVVTELIITATIFASIALGIYPYGYDRLRRRIVSSKYCRIYCICVDVILICLALYAWPKEKLVNLERIYYWTLVQLLSQFIIAVNISALFVIMWTNWSEYASVLGIIKEFATFERTYFARHKRLATTCVTYANYMILKSLAMVLRNISYIYVVLVLIPGMSFAVAVVHTIAMILVNVISLVVFHFYMFILATYRYIWIMKQRIKIIAASTGCRSSQLEINEITGVYIRILRLCQQYGRIYGKLMLLCICGVASLNVMTIIVLLFVWRSSENALNMMYCWYVLIINTLDFWLTIAVCELALGTAAQLVELQRYFNNREHMDAALAREVSYCWE
ncbi:putative gustatory receptor 22a [Bactrocera dorsalis]|uniref:Gustatory receptor n=1 Tax=Bactrocera dorsalis TaxID=27457 RepID=A0ABM3K663_BACDO|nr:putative gustatory receptor 22a [Bactrocera dorsalis]